jgi:hypothetical protein
MLPNAHRGARALPWPGGFVRAAHGVVSTDPTREVHRRRRRVCAPLLQRRAASNGLRPGNAPCLQRPRRARCGAVGWPAPTGSALRSLRTPPAAAGACTSGRTRTLRRGPGPSHARPPPGPQEAGTVGVQDHDPADSQWATSEHLQARRQDHSATSARQHTRGVPRPGTALRHGLVAGGACGHTMGVQDHTGPRALCQALRPPDGVPGGHSLPAAPLDAAVVQAFGAALAPGALDADRQAMPGQAQQEEALDPAPRPQIARWPSHAALAERPLHRVAPDHRRVAAALARRGEHARRDLPDAPAPSETRGATPTAVPPLAEERRTACQAVGQPRPPVWPQGRLAPARTNAR